MDAHDDDTRGAGREPVTVATNDRDGEPRPAAVAEPVREVYRSGRRLDDDIDVEIPEALNLRRDRVRWGPIVAGLCTALTTLVMLGLLGAAIGLTVVNAGTAAAQGGPPPDAGRNSAIWGALAALIAFLLGGYVAAWTAAVFDRGWGALNGALVFLLAVPVTLLLAGMGLGTVLGSLGSFASGLSPDPGQVQGAANQARDAAANVQPIDVARAAEGVRNAAWGALAGSLVGLGASALGGYLGTRRELEIDRRTGQVSE
jgi:hypothetical protein